MIQDLQRIFPTLGITAQVLQQLGGLLIYPEKKRFAYAKEKFDANGVRTAVVIYALVRDSFVMPAWIQGQVLDDLDVNNPIDHVFMGHEQFVPDPPGEVPEEQIA